MALPPSTANWHWKNKNITPWAKSWFEGELPSITIKGDGEQLVSISEVTEVDGDVELGQRKSKLITIYDCKIELKWTGVASDGTEVNGTLSVPEVSHEITLDGLSEYSYIWSLTTPSSPNVDALFHFAKQRIPSALEKKFSEFPVAIIDTHGKDLTVSATNSAQPSRGSTPAPFSETAATTSAPIPTPLPTAVSAPKATRKDKDINTSTVSVEAIFMATATDLFGLLTDEKRIPMWTRAPAQSNPQPDGEYSLFGGGVKGKYVSFEPSKKIIQTWGLSSPTWPSNHTATLTTTFDQKVDSTTVTLTLQGVPLGMEDETKRNLEGYYVQGLKSIGYVRLVPYEPPPQPLPPAYPSADKQRVLAASNSPNKQFMAILLAVLALATAFIIPLISQKSQ